MLRKKPVKGSEKISVTFETHGSPDASRIGIAGDWNDWDPSRVPMRKRKDGVWAATVRFDRGARHEYRYVVDGERWLVDDEADGQVSNPFGELNSVLTLREADD